MSVYCLLDTNSIVKRYHTESGTEIVDYLFDRSPAAIIYLPNTQVVEVIKIFYGLRVENKIKTDEIRDTIIDTFLKEIDNGINNGKIKLYDLANEHLKDLGVYEPIFKIPRPVYYVRSNTGKLKIIKKKRSDTIDAIMLLIMREVHYLAEIMKEEAYLVTSDEHVLEVAKSLKLKTLNPENQKINNIPLSLDGRRYKREQYPSFKVICNDCSTDQPLGSTSTVDFCEGGICVRRHQNFIPGKNIKVKISNFNTDRNIIERTGEIIWSKDWKSAIKFSESIPSNLYTAITNN